MEADLSRLLRDKKKTKDNEARGGGMVSVLDQNQQKLAIVNEKLAKV